MTGLPRNRLKLAKEQGCSAFRTNGKIHLPELLAFVATDEFEAAALAAEREARAAAEWDIRLAKARALTAESQLARARAKTWDAELAKTLFNAGDEAMLEVLKTALLEELPALIAGKAAGEILRINRDFHYKLVGDLRAARVAAMEQAAEAFAAEHPEDD